MMSVQTVPMENQCHADTDIHSGSHRNPNGDRRSDEPSHDGINSLESVTESFNPDELLVFGAKQIISLFVPVTICMTFVVIVASTVDFYAHTDQYLIYTPFHTPDADVGTQTWQTIANTLIFMSFIVVMTCVLVLLFKYNCYKLIRGWLIMTTFFLLFFISFIFFTQVVQAAEIFVDYVTIAFILWNFGVVGMMVIHWRGPLILQQGYLIFVSAQIALLFLKYLPKWTCWVLLGALAIWDLVAVLAPRGPLRMLVEMANERQQPLFPALLYSTTAVYLVTALNGDQHTKDEQQPTSISSSTAQQAPSPSANLAASSGGQSPLTVNDQNTHGENMALTHNQFTGSEQIRHRHAERLTGPQDLNASSLEPPSDPANTRRIDQWREVQSDLREREERGVKLGLGDFVFYSLLMGRATLDGDAITVATCYVAILVGMCVTIIVLGITRRALPALPISITCGILFYFVTSLVISPFLEALATERLFF